MAANTHRTWKITDTHPDDPWMELGVMDELDGLRLYFSKFAQIPVRDIDALIKVLHEIKGVYTSND